MDVEDCTPSLMGDNAREIGREKKRNEGIFFMIVTDRLRVV